MAKHLFRQAQKSRGVLGDRGGERREEEEEREGVGEERKGKERRRRDKC